MNGVTNDSEIYELPYACPQQNMNAPYVVYNSELGVIEVMGNAWFTNYDCSQHYFFQTNKQFQSVSYPVSLWTPTSLSSIVHVEPIGTISIVGYNNQRKQYVKDVRVVTPSTTIGIDSYDNYLQSFPGNASYRTAATVDKNVVYVVGGQISGGGQSHQIYSIDFNGVSTYDDAKQRNWKFLDNLSDGVMFGTVQFYDSQLFVAGIDSNDVTYGNVYRRTID